MSSKNKIKSNLDQLSPNARIALDAHFNLIDRIAWFTQKNESYEIYSPEKPICDELVKLGILIKVDDAYTVPPQIHDILEHYAP